MRQRSNDYATKSGYKFCSRYCFSKFQKGRKIGRVKKQERKNLFLIACAYCQQPIYRWRYRMAQKNQFCSRKCQGKWNSINKIAENAYNWKGGLNYLAHKILTNPRYLKIRKQVLNRDNFSCALCKSSIKLEVHHIIEKKENILLVFDQNNMITLCKSCHCSIRGREKDYRGYFNDIVANRVNSGKPYRVNEGNPEPSIEIAKRLNEGVETKAEETIMPNSALLERDNIVRANSNIG
ncbi:MAG: HNH endonuclease signature motif containing protein [Candidatus Omnitrophota bacterium]